MVLKNDRGMFNWFGVIFVTLILIALQDKWSWLSEYPEDFILPITAWLNVMMDWLVENLGWFFLGVSWFLEWPIKSVQWVLHVLPWAATTFLFCVLAYVASGWRLVFFTLASCLYMVVIGYWPESMNTLSLVAISVPLAILIGFGIGVWGFYSSRAERSIMPMLDMLQTIPVFAYLLPILMLFGFGTVVGLIASVLYSFPPMVRNTIVGLRQVLPEVIESGLMSGATPRQLFWQVRVPTARKQLLLGVNQSTMASLSMVIIASIIGGTSDIGWEVLSTIRKAQFGESLLAGLVIALMAMVIDRITAGMATRSDDYDRESKTWVQRHRYWIIAAIGTAVAFALAQVVTILGAWPRELEFNPASEMNEALTYFIINFRSEIESIKTFAFFFIMLPTKIGLQGAISPFTWGFELKTWHIIAYTISTLTLALWSGRRWGIQIAISVLLFALFLYIGVTKMPWPAMLLICVFAAWRIGGRNLAFGTFLGLIFLVVTGMWFEAMLSIYLCGIAAIISFVLGTALGIWASTNEKVSAIIRPINDTLQTMPLFVIIIPFVMVFKIGEFTALLAIIAYSIVPSIRYAEHGLRNLPEGVIEAAKMMGGTNRQLLWQVKIPLALPVMMLGLNQTIMYAIAMLVIAALVGTNGLEQLVYIGLSDGDFGLGIVAGTGMAIIAIIVDRMTQAWSKKRQAELGLGV
ncbi:MAG: glycine betaine/proline transport system permease protein [Candidatus Azotimanducaceae bacterium]|jgi:glycine betaine/proline transport system permease protein